VCYGRHKMSVHKFPLRRIWPLVKRVPGNALCLAVSCLVLLSCTSRHTDGPTPQQIANSLQAQGADPKTAQNVGEAVVKGIAAVEYRPEDIQAALSASTVFYEHLSAEQYDAIYDASSAQLRTSTSRDALVRFLRKVNRTTGKCGGPTLVVTTAGSDDVGKFVELRYTRNCPNLGEVRETLSWSIAADKPLLRSYFASNPALTGD
jgi:hypothetical protein